MGHLTFSWLYNMHSIRLGVRKAVKCCLLLNSLVRCFSVIRFASLTETSKIISDKLAMTSQSMTWTLFVAIVAISLQIEITRAGEGFAGLVDEKENILS